MDQISAMQHKLHIDRFHKVQGGRYFDNLKSTDMSSMEVHMILNGLLRSVGRFKFDLENPVNQNPYIPDQVAQTDLTVGAVNSALYPNNINVPMYGIDNDVQGF